MVCLQLGATCKEMCTLHHTYEMLTLACTEQSSTTLPVNETRAGFLLLVSS